MRGSLREYVEIFFPNRENITSTSNMYVGRSSFAKNLIAVVLDLDIEGALK